MKRKVKEDFLRKMDGPSKLISDMSTVLQMKMHFNEATLQSSKEAEYRDSSNIYMICTRPHIRFAKGTIREIVDNEGVECASGLLEVHQGGGVDHVAFEADTGEMVRDAIDHWGIPRDQVESVLIDYQDGAFPHTTVIANLDVLLRGGHVAKLAHEMEVDKFKRYFKWYIPELQDMKIEYIGKSVGIDVPSNSSARLEAHKYRTLIVSEASQRGDTDVIGLYMSFDAKLFTQGLPPESIDMPRPNLISLIEGALINHFQPRYNRESKEVYPHNSELRKTPVTLGLKSLEVSVSGDKTCFRMHTDTIARSFFHVSRHSFDEHGLGATSRASTTILNPRAGEEGSQQLRYRQLNTNEVQHESDILRDINTTSTSGRSSDISILRCEPGEQHRPSSWEFDDETPSPRL